MLRVALAIALGLLCGFIVGGTLAMVAGTIYVDAIDASCRREGYCGMLIFGGFMSIGAIVGAVICTIAAAILAWPHRHVPLAIFDRSRNTGSESS
jgi:hypothetical protein